MAAIGLYHPYIQFKNDSWLKLAALYWDQIARIVPDKFPLQDSDTVKFLEAEGSFVLRQPPTEAELEAVALEFGQLVTERADELRARYGLELVNNWPDDEVTKATEPEGDARLGYVYPTKMNDDLPRLLTRAGLAKFGPSRPDIGLGMHPRLADTYMLALARRIAESTGYEPVTDETRNHVGVSACTAEALADSLLREVAVAAPRQPDDAEAFLLTLSFGAVIPQGLDDIPVKKLLEVRKRWEPERRRFHAGIRKIVADLGPLAEVPNPEARQKHLNAAYEADIEQPLKELRKHLERASIEFFMGAFSSSTVLPAASVGALLTGSVVPWAAMPAALAFDAYKLFSARRTNRDELRKSSVSYLVRLERDLKPTTLSGWVDEKLRGLSFGQ